MRGLNGCGIFIVTPLLVAAGRKNMVRKLFVGNLDRTITDPQLKDIFAPYGEVLKANVVFHRQTGESRRFGFVVMATDGQAGDAMKALDGATVSNRSIRVSPARERHGPLPESNQRLRLRLPFRLVSTRARLPHED
jgi:RNA recognition motif-containing protein